MQDLSTLQLIAVAALPLILAITLHEAAHAWAAFKLGDNTAKMSGRVSLNPIRHIDPVGTILLPASLLAFSSLLGGAGFIFGWAKPVPVNWHNLNNPRRDMALVAAAGPGANLLMALAWTVVLKIADNSSSGLDSSLEFVLITAYLGVFLNLVLMVLNLLPLLPLDGGRIVYTLLPHNTAQKYAQTEPYGIIILLVLLMTGVLHYLLAPVDWLRSALFYLFF